MTPSYMLSSNLIWLLIPIGLFLGLLGYRLYKISIFIIGLFLGLGVGMWIGESVDNVTLGYVLGAIMGIAFGVATHFLIRFGLFLAGMAGGFVLTSWILQSTAVPPGSGEAWLWVLGGALAGGLVTLILYKALILVITSLIGAYMIYVGTASWFTGLVNLPWLRYTIIIVLFAVFIVVQAGSRKGRPDPIDQEKERRRR